MKDHVRWLREELAKAREALSEKQERLRVAEREYAHAKQEFEGLQLVLRRARGRRAKTMPEFLELTPALPRRRSRPTMADVAEQILDGQGPLGTAELLALMDKAGIQTTRNSLNTTLNHFRPGRFERDEEGRWYLVG